MLKCSSPYQFEQSDLCCIIPTFNNAGTIVDVVKGCLLITPHVMVVNDGSTDNTLNVLHPYLKRIILISYAQNKGKGEALKRGFQKAQQLGYRYALTLDGDGQHYPTDIPLLIEHLKLHPDSIIVGERKQRGQTAGSKFANRFANFWFTIQTLRHLNDTQSGMRIYPLQKLPNLKLLTSRYEAELELLVWSAWRNIDIQTAHINVYYPPKQERISHFQPARDFTRISIFNTLMCFAAFIYGYPSMLVRKLFSSEYAYYPLMIIKWLIFILGSILFFLPISYIYFLFKGNNDEAQKKYHKFIQRHVLGLITMRHYLQIKVHNDYNEQFTKPAVIICNHQSLIDILTLLSLSPNIIIIAKESFGRNPIIGPILRFANFHPVSDGIENITGKLREKISQGWSIAVFPEGTRTLDGNIMRFHRGAFYLAEEFNLDIVPCYMENTFSIMPKGCHMPHRGVAHLHILPRIKPNDTCFGMGFRKRTKNFERWYRHLVADKPTVHIIGAGLGGLVTGALLTRQGYRVCVIEKNQIIGGGLQSFERDGEVFNTGMHIFGGMQEGGSLRKIFDYLGITDKLQLISTPEDAQDIVFTTERKSYKMPRGKDAIIEYLGNLFPNEKEGLKAYFNDLYTIADSFDLYRLRPHQAHPEVEEIIDLTAAQLIERHIKTSELQQLLCYNDVLIGYRPENTPVGMFAMIQLHYLEGEFRMKNGSIEIAEALSDVIRQAGGFVISNQEVTHLEIERMHVRSLTTDKGLRLPVQTVVSAIAPRILLQLTDTPILRNLAYKRINEPHDYDSGFIVFVKLKPDTFRYIQSTVFLPMPNSDKSLASHLLIVTKSPYDGYASNMEILVPCHYSEFQQWEDSTVGHRQKEYYDKKNAMAQNIIKYVSEYYPQLPEAIDKIYTSSPLTIRDYYNNPQGSIFGQQGIFAPLATHINNLFLTGQANIYHGMCGVPLTAIRTAQIVSGKDILNEL